MIEPDTLSPEVIIEKIGQPVTFDAATGLYHCPVCPFTHRLPALGPHILTHWRDADAWEGRPHGKDRVACPLAGCRYASMRTNMAEHLASSHSIERRAAAGMARVAGFDLDEYRQARAEKAAAVAAEQAAAEQVAAQVLGADLVPVVDREGFVRQGPIDPPAAMSATDIALAVVMSQVNGSIPSDALPDVVDYVDSTRRLVAKLSG